MNQEIQEAAITIGCFVGGVFCLCWGFYRMLGGIFKSKPKPVAQDIDYAEEFRNFKD